MALWPAAHERPHLQVGYMAAPTSNCKSHRQSGMRLMAVIPTVPSIHQKWKSLMHRPQAALRQFETSAADLAEVASQSVSDVSQGLAAVAGSAKR